MEPISAPIVNFSIENNGCSAPCEVTFNGTLDGFLPERFKWIIEDEDSTYCTDRTSIDIPVSHQYVSAGQYKVKLIAEWNGPPDDQKQAENIVTIVSSSDSRPDFTFTNQNCKAPCTVIFTAINPDNADSYEWDFGDGETGIGKIISHTYQRPNANGYDATLTVNVSTEPITKDVIIDYTTFDTLLSGTGTATDIVQLEDGGFVWVGYHGQMQRIDKDGNEIWTQTDYTPPVNAHFYGVIQDIYGKFVALENQATTFFNRSKPAWIRFGDGILDGNKSLLDDGENGYASDIDLADNGDYLFVGTKNGPGDSVSLIQFRYPGGGSPILTSFGVASGDAYGGRIHSTNSGIICSGQFISGNTKLFVNGELKEPQIIDFLPFVPVNNNEIMVMAGFGYGTSPSIKIIKYSISTGDATQIAEINDAELNEYFPMEIIAREDGGYAGVALAKDKDSNLIQGDFNNPNSIFFLIDEQGNLDKFERYGTNGADDYLFTIKQTRDGGFVMVGSKGGKPRIIKTDNIGEL